MLEVLGDRRAVLCRELTKRYEQYLRGSLSQLRADLAEQGTRGEFVILVEGQRLLPNPLPQATSITRPWSGN